MHRGALAIFALALMLRLWGITFGLPYDFTADEPHYIVQALKVGAGEGGPLVRIWHTVGKGGLDYLLFIEYGVVFAVLWLAGAVREPRDFALLYLQDPTVFYVVGRVTIAVLGAATVLAVFSIARRVYDVRVGLAAAFIGAVTYYHVAASHIISVHVPMAFALTAALAAYVRFERTRQKRLLVIAGVLLGAAIAMAYTAGLGLLIMLGAIATNRESWRQRMKDSVVLVLPTLAAIALMSPDLLLGAGLLLGNFGISGTSDGTSSTRSLIDSVTILRTGNWSGFFQLWLQSTNLPITIAAVVGAVLGISRRERWTVIFSVAIVFFLGIVSVSNRGISEMYLFPVAPALWILAGRSLWGLPTQRWAMAPAVLLIAGYSLYAVVRDNTMISHPDTREIAKEWIETHVPSGAKILMDGMRFRFVQSVPLNPDQATVARRLEGLASSELGMSDEMLSLYREAAASVSGPTYELHSTVYGLEVRDIDEYVRESFDYVVISSFNEKRYASEADRARYPKSARFYEQVRTDPRLHVVFSIEPALWRRSGPALTVYAIKPQSVPDDGVTSDRR
jgi:hypothetical protein